MDGKENLSLRAYLAIGMMLFALFFGAGINWRRVAVTWRYGHGLFRM